LAAFRGRPNFELELDIASQDSLQRSDLMISDWSGAALEYAFGLERPVLFVDVARKVNNPDYEQLGIEPLEVSVRERIGRVVDPSRLDAVPAAVEALVSDASGYRQQIRETRAQTVHNVGTSGRVAAEFIASKADDYLRRQAS
jgi:YidC/Oxa1 family membrane protein insertase